MLPPVGYAFTGDDKNNTSIIFPSPIDDPGFTGLVLRRKKEDVRGKGKLWGKFKETFVDLLGAKANENYLTLSMPSGAEIQLAGVQFEKDTGKYQGGEFVWVALEEATQFTWSQFLDLLRCNRPTKSSKTTPWMDLTVNPDPGSWVLDLIRPFIIPEGEPGEGNPDRDVCGELRWFTLEDDQIKWVDEEWRDVDGLPGLSVTYIPALVDENPTIVVKDPTYKAKLRAQTDEKVAHDLKGNWFATASNSPFSGAPVKWIDAHEIPDGLENLIRYWDLAATERKKEEKRNLTAGCLGGFVTCPTCDGWRYVGESEPCPTCNTWSDRGEMRAIVDLNSVAEPEQIFVWVDQRYAEVGPDGVVELVRHTALEDGVEVPVAFEEEAGASGKLVTSAFDDTYLPEFEVIGDPPKGTKTERSNLLVVSAKRGNLWIVRHIRSQRRIRDALRDFPRRHRDIIDSATGCYKVASGYDFGGGWGVI
jgi:phage terminase large subunit-like protein